MKTFKAICGAIVLALFLSVPAKSNDVHDPGKPSPPPSGIVVEPERGESNESATLGSDISFSTLADALWALASMF